MSRARTRRTRPRSAPIPFGRAGSRKEVLPERSKEVMPGEYRDKRPGLHWGSAGPGRSAWRWSATTRPRRGWPRRTPHEPRSTTRSGYFLAVVDCRQTICHPSGLYGGEIFFVELFVHTIGAVSQSFFGGMGNDEMKGRRFRRGGGDRRGWFQCRMVGT
jgi:hypothetical protein